MERVVIWNCCREEIHLTQGQVTLVDDVDYEYLMQWEWCAIWDGKSFRAKRTNNEKKTILMYTVIAERMGIDFRRVDHIDHNPNNNQRSNLRFATVSQNLHNRGPNKNSTTGVKGVYLNKANGRYKAQIRVEGKYYYLGYFDTIPEAAVVVQKKRRELVGEFACH